MKHHICYSLLIAAAVSLACQMERSLDNSSGEMTFYASNVAGTRTLLQTDGSVYWSPNDAINIFCNGVHGKFVSTNTTVSDAVEFKGTLEGLEKTGGEYFWAVYPYSETNTFSNGELTVTLPSEQQASPGTFADDLFISVARTTDDHLYFQNVCGGIKFALADEGIRKVVFRGNKNEPVAGTVKVTLENDLPVISEVLSPATEVSLTAPDGSVFTPGQWYYIVCLPGTLSGGYSIDLYGDELIGTKSGSSSVTVRRSVWGTLQGLTPDKHGIYPVDLGLPSGTQWASCDLGASQPFEKGDLFAAGETESKVTSSWSNYKWCDGSQNTLTKYCSSYEYGEADYRDFLDEEDDAAHAILGDGWWTPTDKEWGELKKYTKRTFHDNYLGSGVPGTLFTSTVEGYTDQSIFIPYAYYNSSTGLGSGSYAFYRISNHIGYSGTSDTPGKCTIIDAVGVNDKYDYLYALHPIRAIYGREEVAVDEAFVGVENSTEWEDYDNGVLMENHEASLIVNVYRPSNAWPRHPKKAFDWTSSNPSVATVSEGRVTAHKSGTTIITATAKNGTASDSFTVTVLAPLKCTTPETIDMGVSVKWAAFNLGANSVSETGLAFAWGEVEPSTLNLYNPLLSYKWWRYSRGYTKYTPVSKNAGAGIKDGLSILQPEDDAATVKLGENWRMPVSREWRELLENCSVEATVINGINGIMLTSHTTGNQLFLPNNLYYWAKNMIDKDAADYSASKTNCEEARCFFPLSEVYDENDRYGLAYRSEPYFIRPVYEEVTDNLIPLDGNHFPDDVFRNYLATSLDVNSDSQLSASERSVLEINVNGQGISSLQGIEYFPGLQKLICNSNKLSELDISNNTELTYLQCSSNTLSSLDLSKNVKLVTLSCGSNSLMELDLSRNTNLLSLSCSNNGFTTLDLSHNIHLQTLTCRIPILDVSHNTELQRLNCIASEIESLDLSHNPLLTSLYCGSNQLTELNLSTNTALQQLSCSNNPLTFLYLPMNSELLEVSCYNTQLTNLDLSQAKKLETLDCKNSALESLLIDSIHLTSLECKNNALTTLDLSQTSSLVELSCSGNQLTRLDCSHTPCLSVLNCSNNQLSELDLNGCSALTQLDCRKNALQEIDTCSPVLAKLMCSDNRLMSLDITSTVLDYLDCTNNSLSTLRFSTNRLEYLLCSDNTLSSLDVAGARRLLALYCSNNTLSDLNLSNLPQLSHLYCSGNQLKSLALTNCPQLTEFNAASNHLTEITFNCPLLLMCSVVDNLLTTIDLSGSPKLFGLYCTGNPLETLYLSSEVNTQYHLIMSLPDGTEVIYQ